MKANHKFTCAQHFRSFSRNSFFQRGQSPTLEFSTATVELPPLLSQVGTHTDGMGGRLEPVKRRRVNQKVVTQQAVSSHVVQKCSTPVCGVLPNAPGPKHSGSPMKGPKQAATDLDLGAIFLANAPLHNSLWIICSFFISADGTLICHLETLCQDPYAHAIRVSYEVVLMGFSPVHKAPQKYWLHRADILLLELPRSEN